MPPAEATDQVGETVTETPAASVPVAVNCWVPPTGRVVVVGETASVAREPGPLMPCTSHAAVNAPANATATITRANRVRGVSPCRLRFLVMLFIKVLLT